MTEHLTVYLHRDHEAWFQLKQRDPETGDTVIVPAYAVTRAVLKLQGDESTYCLDTNDPNDPIQLLDSAQVLGLRLGRIPDLQAGQYLGFLTLFDASTPHGEPWGQGGQLKDRPTFLLRAIEWPICSTED